MWRKCSTRFKPCFQTLVCRIGPEDLVEPKLKLILGLVWTLIVRWQLGSHDKSARVQLLGFVNQKMTIKVNNFTSDWRDGRAIVALVESVFDVTLDVKEEDTPLHKTETAMSFAEGHAIPKVLAPDDLISDLCDEVRGSECVFSFAASLLTNTRFSLSVVCDDVLVLLSAPQQICRVYARQGRALEQSRFNADCNCERCDRRTSI